MPLKWDGFSASKFGKTNYGTRDLVNSLSSVHACMCACVPVLQPRPFDIFGPSALAGRPMDSRSSVRASVRTSVRHTISGDPRIRFWWFFAQSYILMSLKKCSKRIFEKNLVWLFWPIFAIFGHFWPKNQVFELFLQNCTSEFYITCSKAQNNCFQSFNGSDVSGKILVLAVLAHFWSKIHCLWWQIEVFDHFWPISSSLLMLVLTIFVCFFKPSLWFKTRWNKFGLW